LEILVPQKYSVRQVRQAELKRDEFRKNPYTSGCANLDDMIALNKAVILCPDHTRKFSPKAARYRAHPDTRMRRVLGNCDVCQQFVLSTLFLPEALADEEQKKFERFKRAIEYATFVR
jgi:hypothetical protein